MTFGILPDDVLLGIFAFYVDDGNFDEDFEQSDKQRIEKWITLAHVCRRWRRVVFQSPHRLNLRLLCTLETPARDTLDIWPSLPLIIIDSFWNRTTGVDNIIAALEHNDRVCQIQLRSFSSSKWEYFTNSAALQKPFPELTHLWLHTLSKLESKLHDSFLGGTAPRLRLLELWGIPFPGLPKLVLPATQLVDLDLYGIPYSGYIPPDAMAAGLSALTILESLRLDFQYPRPRPALESRRPPPRPPTRSILPRLTKIQFKGASEYLEEILARIDAPQLNNLHITFFNEIIFDTPQLFQFISRRPTLRAPQEGRITFDSGAISIKFSSQTSDGVLSVQILCTASDWQLSSLEQVFTSSLPPVSTLENLYIVEEDLLVQLRWQDDVENMLWLEVLHPFASVKNLYLCKDFVPRIAPALEELVGTRTTDVFPTLEHILLEGLWPSGPLQVQQGIEKFIAARQLTNRPVTVSHWDRDS